MHSLVSHFKLEEKPTRRRGRRRRTEGRRREGRRREKTKVMIKRTRKERHGHEQGKNKGDNDTKNDVS